MKKIVSALALICFQGAFSQQADIRQTIETFFEAFHARDTTKLKAVTANELVMHSINEKPTGSSLSVETRSEFLKSIASIPQSVRYEERLLSWNFQIDGNMAQVWTPYEFYVNGNIVHTGVDSFQLFYDKGNWKIIYIADTRKRI
ncbi:MAG: nuclear transport factor 2 family protein [Flavobacterium sp.]|nr:MAG: nuclear transport factor 2 family protein [Flavobacterium sp.]